MTTLHTSQQKEINDIKLLIRVLKMYIPLPVFWALFHQQVNPLSFLMLLFKGALYRIVGFWGLDHSYAWDNSVKKESRDSPDVIPGIKLDSSSWANGRRSGEILYYNRVFSTQSLFIDLPFSHKVALSGIRFARVLTQLFETKIIKIAHCARLLLFKNRHTVSSESNKIHCSYFRRGGGVGVEDP